MMDTMDIVDLLKILALIVGIFFIAVSLLTYESEEIALQEFFESLWVRIDDSRIGWTDRFRIFYERFTLYASTRIKPIFPDKLTFKSVANIHMSSFVASSIFSMGVVKLMLLFGELSHGYDYSVNGPRVQLFIQMQVGLALLMIGAFLLIHFLKGKLHPKLSYAVFCVFIIWFLSPWWHFKLPFDALLAIYIFWLIGTYALSILFIFLVYFLVSRVVENRSQYINGAALSILGVVTIFVYFYIPYDLTNQDGFFLFVPKESKYLGIVFLAGNTIMASNLLSAIILVTHLCIVVLSVIVSANISLTSRFSYQIQRIELFKNKEMLFKLGIVSIAASFSENFLDAIKILVGVK